MEVQGRDSLPEPPALAGAVEMRCARCAERRPGVRPTKLGSVKMYSDGWITVDVVERHGAKGERREVERVAAALGEPAPTGRTVRAYRNTTAAGPVIHVECRSCRARPRVARARLVEAIRAGKLTIGVTAGGALVALG